MDGTEYCVPYNAACFIMWTMQNRARATYGHRRLCAMHWRRIVPTFRSFRFSHKYEMH